MSTEATASTTPIAEKNVEQESLLSSNEGSVVEPKDVEQTPDDETVSSSFAAVGDNSDEAVADTRTLLQQSSSEAGVATGCANTEDSQGSSDFDGGDGTEVQHGGSTDGGSGKDMQPDPSLPLARLPLDFDDNELAAWNEGCCDYFSRGCDAFCSKLKSCIRWIQGSQLYKAFQFFLFCLAINYIILGIKYLDKCPVMPSFPKLVIMVGMSFLISIVLSWVFDLYDTPRPQFRYGYLYVGMMIARLVFLILFIDGLVVKRTMSPSSDSKSEFYCDEGFCKMINLTNFFILGVFLVSCCMYVPFLNLNTNGYTPL